MALRVVFLLFTVQFFALLVPIKVFGFALPVEMDGEGKKNVVEVLGFGTLMKFHSNPYPLGGYQGLELSIGQEAVSSGRLAQAGSEESSAGYFTYTNFSVGKGFYSNFDVFFNFAPFGQKIQSQIFGLLLRWNFFDRSNFRLSAVLHGNGVNVQNQYFSDSSGLDLVASSTFRQFDYYVGFGETTVNATFAGSLLAVGENTREKRSAYRHFIGLNYQWQSYFATAEYHRVVENTYSFKLGYRF